RGGRSPRLPECQPDFSSKSTDLCLALGRIPVYAAVTRRTHPHRVPLPTSKVPLMSDTLSLLDLLPEQSVQVDASADDWRTAIRLAGEGLIRSGVAPAEYSGEMIAAVGQLGPYIVIAPGLALAHSRPSPAVRRTGLSWVSLRTPVRFGHQDNDPVRVVVGLAATDHSRHTAALGGLAQLLGAPGRLEELLTAPDAATVRRLIGSFEPEVQS